MPRKPYPTHVTPGNGQEERMRSVCAETYSGPLGHLMKLGWEQGCTGEVAAEAARDNGIDAGSVNLQTLGLSPNDWYGYWGRGTPVPRVMPTVALTGM